MVGVRKLLQSPMTTYKLIWERFTLSAQSQRKGRKMGHSSKATSCPSLLMKAAGVCIKNKTLIRFEIILLACFIYLFFKISVLIILMGLIDDRHMSVSGL